MPDTVRREGLVSVLGMVLILGGCPKRQAAPRIVYVPSPAPAPQAAETATTQTLVIEEPAPPPEEPATPPPQPAETAAKPVRRVRRLPHPEAATTPSSEADTEPEPAEPVPAEVPPLEPRESSREESTLRHEILGLEGTVQARIARLDAARLSNGQRKALDDARTFLAQSSRALGEGDLQRSLTLARKASLLVTAVEQGQ